MSLPEWKSHRFYVNTPSVIFDITRRLNSLLLCFFFSSFLGVVVGVFYLCWIPFLVAVVLSAFCKDLITPVVVLVISTLVFCNSAINPVLYGFLNREFRLAYKRLLPRLSRVSARGIPPLKRRRGYDVSQLSLRDNTSCPNVQGVSITTLVTVWSGVRSRDWGMKMRSLQDRFKT